jgi:hypothetical protein
MIVAGRTVPRGPATLHTPMYSTAPSVKHLLAKKSRYSPPSSVATLNRAAPRKAPADRVGHRSTCTMGRAASLSSLPPPSSSSYHAWFLLYSSNKIYSTLCGRSNPGSKLWGGTRKRERDATARAGRWAADNTGRQKAWARPHAPLRVSNKKQTVCFLHQAALRPPGARNFPHGPAPWTSHTM